MKALFPTTPTEWTAFFCCYALFGLLWWMVTHAPQTGAFLRGLIA